MYVNVVFVLARVGDVDSQVLEVIDEGDKSSFHFDDLYLFALGVLFILTCAFLFITFFFFERTGCS